ncbi:hypothetical protein AT15_04900 [Kosmotoga arenicorallina S304]|uniref:histidine kinase n=1 Tax=Kosmotoga arenicorallina S304 TaxID=1453497 RepID=A0A176JWG4_9BACT|nr:HAMP domain-containing sensor histidine kinase [Kosmotoga arenicorallina]OAA28025.1 hypothetical protein AT15_04900 [Kosmotoga arenicorallina S304]
MYSKSKNIFFITLVSILSSLIVVMIAYLFVRNIVIGTAKKNVLMISKEIRLIRDNRIDPRILNKIPVSLFWLKGGTSRVLHDALDIAEQLDLSRVKNNEFMQVDSEMIFTSIVETPEGKLIIAQPGEKIAIILQKTSQAFFLVWVVSTGIMLIFVFIYYRRTTGSFRELIEKAEEISRKLEGYLPAEGLDRDTARFISALNKMIERLRANLEEEKRFASYAAHELKTPLANIIGYTNMLLRWGLQNEEVARKSLITISKTAEKLNSLVTKLLMLSSSGTDDKLEKIDLCDLISSIIEECRDIYPSRNIRIDCEEKSVMRLPKEPLEAVFKIFLDNAVKHSPPNVDITVIVKKDRLGVSNPGPKIVEEYKQKIFEPFFRLNFESEGHGLGLTIAKNIALKYSWQLEVESEEGVNIFWLIFR